MTASCVIVNDTAADGSVQVRMPARILCHRRGTSATLASVFIAAGLLTAEGAHAQSTSAASSAFEVASIKPSQAQIFTGPVSPDRFVRSHTTLEQLVMYAYDVDQFRLQGGAQW